MAARIHGCVCKVDWVVRILGLRSDKSQLVGGCASDLLFWKVFDGGDGRQ